MFHRAGGKLFYIVVTIGFFLLSLQNTWAFLNKTLPGASWLFLVMMLIVFEGGFVGWLAMLMGGAENVWRVLISLAMMLITGTGVFVGAYYEIGGMMNQGIGYTVDPGVLAFVPKSVIFAYIATGVAVVLYGLASPEFFHRMSHMNATGQPPVPGSRIEMLFPGSSVSRQQLLASQQRLALPAPSQQGPTLVNGGGRGNRLGNWLVRKLAGRPASEEVAATLAQTGTLPTVSASGPVSAGHRTCSECTTSFEVKNAKQLTCSPACRTKRARRLARERKAAVTV